METEQEIEDHIRLLAQASYGNCTTIENGKRRAMNIFLEPGTWEFEIYIDEFQRCIDASPVILPRKNNSSSFGD